jgi:uncharacterized protein (DUF58 family)
MMRRSRWPVVIGPRGIALLLALAVLVALAGFVIGTRPALALAAVVFVAALIADVLLTQEAPHIAVAIPPHLALAKHDALHYTIANRAATVRRVAIFASPAARLATSEAPAYATVAARTEVTATIPFVPRERGSTTIPPAFVWSESTLGIVRRRYVLGDDVAVRVMPDLSALERGDLARRSRLIDLGLRRLRRRGVGSEFESLREYGPGDAFRAIDWKATARRGKLMVTQREVERSQSIVVALDAGRLMAARLGDRRKLDYAVSAALAIAKIAQLADDRVSLHAFSDRTLASVPGKTGPGHIARFADALTDLEPSYVEADYERAALEIKVHNRKRSLVVVFTDLVDPVASTAVLGSLALLVPQHLVLVVLMNDAAIATALDRDPQTTSDVYRSAVATALGAERARAIALLGERGIGVVDVPARDLTIALLDAYVTIKTRGLI